MENMPREIKEYELGLARKFSEKMADDGEFLNNINKWLKEMNFLHEGGDVNAKKLPLQGHITTTKGNGSGNYNEGNGSVEPGKKPKSNIGKSPLYAGLKDKESPNKSLKGKINAMPEVILDSSKSDDDEWVWYEFDDHKVYLNAKCRMIDYYAKEAHRQNKTLNLDTHRANTIVVLRKVLSTHIALTRFGSNNLSEEDKREILENDKNLSVCLLNPFLITKEILLMSKNLKQQLAVFNKQGNGVHV